MSTKENYDLSVDLWVKSQENNISLLKTTIDYLNKEIEIKKQSLDLALKTLEHEEKFLNDYLKEVKNE